MFRKAGSNEWMPAKVPGVVHLDLMRNKIIQDPFQGDNESKLQWISDVGWEYKKTFRYEKENFEWRRIELVCQGIDTYANVYLNDSLVLVTNNMFRDWYADIKRFLLIGTNTLRIQFPALSSMVKTEYDKLPRKLPGDERVVCRKAAYHFGWDWGPKLMTSGIWKSIYIRHWNYVNVLGVNFIQKSLTDSLADMAAQFTIFSSVSDSARIRITLDSTEVFNTNVMLNKGPNVIRGDFYLLKPQRWWPNGMGNPVLYNFRYEVEFAGSLVGEGNQKIGLRTVELVQDKDSAGSSFYFKVNGKPVFIKGANYIPQDNFLPRVTDNDYRTLITNVKQSNMNMLRVWGGGVYEKDIFYDLCDENGIMIWQDFMFACAMYPGSKEFLDNVRDEVIQQIVRLRRHPSIALWCGNNEVDEGWKNWGWQKQYGYSPEDSAAVYRDYRLIFNVIIPNNIKRFDTLRPYFPSSPLHGWGRSQSMTEGDSHYWGVWWGKEPFSVYRNKVGRFMSEYGFQGFPDINTIKAFTKPEDRQLKTKVMKAHQKHPVGYETIDEYLLRDYRKPKDFESYTYVSQLLQAEGIGTAIEAHRRAKPYCMGTMYWQLNDCWPGVSWSSQDYYGRKKALGFRIPELFDRILISPVAENERVKVFISSDAGEMMQAIMTVKVIDFEGNIHSDEGYALEIDANSSFPYYDTLTSALLSGLDPKKVMLLVTLDGGMNDFKLKKTMFFKAPKDLDLTVPVISKKLTSDENGYTLQLSSDKLAKNVWLTSSVPGEFSNNYFDILPGEVVDIKFNTKTKIALREDMIVVKSLVDSY